MSVSLFLVLHNQKNPHMLHDNQHALARYNSLFDNQQYQAIAHSIADDLRLESELGKDP